ncbi:hypothetical protein Phi17218_080 [Cellulophaga phage phi17:2_18]|uniref:Uncharacterized protein n=2 Tax=Lightbulbvirus Cba172 TaxID=1918525 RepID=S0A074_9CAUD|nr:hypothetical protein Phi17:2_gp080 [Cellulophaga phage phi17:2]AGO47613.1 hypothetical protein Phi17:2_gp080 [Cellulophaga phage phi17:2]ALO80483.1 hypothetical protein Phi17218_080 [Cellulophaga phage phi17:2_18]
MIFGSGRVLSDCQGIFNSLSLTLVGVIYLYSTPNNSHESI